MELLEGKSSTGRSRLPRPRCRHQPGPVEMPRVKALGEHTLRIRASNGVLQTRTIHHRTRRAKRRSRMIPMLPSYRSYQPSAISRSGWLIAG